MTTKQYAELLNALAGARLFNDRDIREAVRRGELHSLNPARGPRYRVKIAPSDFCRYVAKHHPDLLAGARERFGIAA